MSESSYDPTRPLYNSRILQTYVKLIKKDYPHIDVEELVKNAGMELHQVEDEGHWFSQQQVNRFHEKLSQLTGNPNIGREAGLYSASPEAMGGIARYVLGLTSPARVYSLIGKFTKKFTRSSTYVSSQVGSHTVEIVVTPKEGVQEQPFQCQNRLGYIEALSKLFKYKLPKVEHPECLFKGSGFCRYLVTWQPSPSVRWKKLRLASLPLLAAAFLATWFYVSAGAAVSTVLPLSAVFILLLSWFSTYLHSRELQAAVNQLESSSDELIEQISVNYDNALMINEIGQALSRKSDLTAILSTVVHILQKRLDFDRGLVLLANRDKSRLIGRTGYGYRAEELQRFMTGSGFHLDRADSKGVFVRCFKEQKPYLVNDIEKIKHTFTPRSLEFARRMGVKAFICCPIAYEDEPLGVLAVDNIRTKRPLLERDVNLLMGIAPQIAVCIHNVRLVEARLQQFQSILQVLVASTEARDPITAGHSLKVTEYAVGICHELDLPTDYTDVIRVAASLHDYGKIAFDDAILKKPGRLDKHEYETIKKHVVKTREILEQVNFDGIYRDVPVIAGAHHEKVDGSGYPGALRGEEIPLGGKILAVADVFEALTSKRHYREPMRLEDALAELVNNIDQHFEKKCVEALIRYYHLNVDAVPAAYHKFLGGSSASN